MWSQSVVFIAILACVVSANGVVITPRIQAGYVARSGSDFPHFVHIAVSPKTGAARQCAGSIVDARWVLTSLSCTVNASKITLYFGLLELNKTATATQMEVGPDAVRPYPTNVDDLSLVMLPSKLNFSSTISAIKIARVTPEPGAFTTVPGFLTGQNILRYGFFRLQSSSVCGTYSDFDSHTQLCTVGWTNPSQRPCKGHEGSGLITNWPEKPELIGVFSKPNVCSGTSPAVYISLERYHYWIESEIQNTPTVRPTTFSS